MRVLLVALALTGCLFAPPRPSAEGDGGVPDAAVADGGVDADLAACSPTESALLDVVAAVPSPDGQTDILVRAGTDRGTGHVYLYKAGPDPLRLCADAVIAFTFPESGASRVIAVAPGRPGYLVVLAEATGGMPLAVLEIDLTTLMLQPSRIEVPSSVGPFGTNPASPFVAFAADEDTRQIWLGGPGLTTIDVTAGFGAPATPLSTLPSPGGEDKYLFAVPTDDSAVAVELVGQLRAYRGGLAVNSSVTVTQSDVRDPTDCDMNPVECTVQIVRPVLGGPARAAGYTHVVLRPDSGGVAFVPVASNAYMLRATPMPAFDVALDDFNGGDLDIVTLHGSPRIISVFLNLAGSGEPTRIYEPVPDAVERILVGTFTMGAGRQILGLSVSPGAVGVGESCLQLLFNTLRHCSGR